MTSFEGIATEAGMVVSDTRRTDGRWFARVKRTATSAVPKLVRQP